MVPLNRHLIQSHSENFSGKPISKLTGNWNNQEQIWELKQFKLCTLKGKAGGVPHSISDTGWWMFARERRKSYFNVILVNHFIWLVTVGERRTKVLCQWKWMQKFGRISLRDGTNFPTETLVLSLCPSNINNSIFFNQIDKNSPLLPPNFSKTKAAKHTHRR